MTRMHQYLLVACATTFSVGLTACGGSPSQSASTTTTRETTTTAQVIASSTVTLNGKTYPVPTESPGDPIKPFSDTGQQMVLTSSGFLPSQLYAATAQPVVVTNLTPKTVTITMTGTGAPPHTLAPGASFSYTPTVLAYGYGSSTGKHSVVNVGAFTSNS
jgi:hypothetical protein